MVKYPATTLGHPGATNPLPPPSPPAGWEIGPPDFVGVGAARCGTSWWWSLLYAHPGIAHTGDVERLRSLQDRGDMNELYVAKELHFFDQFEQVETVDPMSYYKYFPRPAGRLAGEWTPGYMYFFWAAPMLRALAPDTKILVLLRDPVDRFLSGVANRTAWGDRPASYMRQVEFDRGCYGHQLSTLTAHFDRSQIQILQYEKCRANPIAELERTLTFLGLDPELLSPPCDIERSVGTIQPPALALNSATRRELYRAYRSDLRLLLEEFPEIDGSLWHSAMDL